MAQPGRLASTAGQILSIHCPSSCTFHPARIGDHAAGALKALRETGAGGRVMLQRATELGYTAAESSMFRHLHHYREAVPESEQEPFDENAPRPTDVAILDSIIVSGFKNSRNWKPTIKDTLDAMKLKTAMTGQSAFEDMLSALEQGLAAADDADLAALAGVGAEADTEEETGDE